MSENATEVINLRRVPNDLKRRFKRKCRANDVSMRDALVQLMQMYATGKVRLEEPATNGKNRN